MSNLQDFARAELTRAGVFNPDSDYDGMLGKAVMELIETFSRQGHSGMSAGMTLAMFKKVAAFEPLGPLTGDDDEWTEVASGMWQNKRCSHVFKEIDGRPYDINGIVFREPSGACFTSRESRVYVTFPYTPTIEYRERPGPFQDDSGQPISP